MEKLAAAIADHQTLATKLDEQKEKHEQALAEVKESGEKFSREISDAAAAAVRSDLNQNTEQVYLITLSLVSQCKFFQCLFPASFFVLSSFLASFIVSVSVCADVPIFSCERMSQPLSAT